MYYCLKADNDILRLHPGENSKCTDTAVLETHISPYNGKTMTTGAY